MPRLREALRRERKSNRQRLKKELFQMNKYKEKPAVKYACLIIGETHPEFLQEEFADLDIHFLDKWRKYED